MYRTRTQGVPGVGPADAKIMFVGEAPGRQEDLKGEPFVGDAGRVFDELLASIGQSRAQVYVTNVLKSRPFVGPPPGRNRPPARDEIVACAPWLVEELQIIHPKFIVTLGQIALAQFLPGRRLSDLHGRPQLVDGTTVLPLYHPAMARFPRWIPILKRDFKAIPRLLRHASTDQ